MACAFVLIADLIKTHCNTKGLQREMPKKINKYKGPEIHLTFIRDGHGN